jgi:hypothetical protein
MHLDCQVHESLSLELKALAVAGARPVYGRRVGRARLTSRDG